VAHKILRSVLNGLRRLVAQIEEEIARINIVVVLMYLD
jgi:hypothetical protein